MPSAYMLSLKAEPSCIEAMAACAAGVARSCSFSSGPNPAGPKMPHDHDNFQRMKHWTTICERRKLYILMERVSQLVLSAGLLPSCLTMLVHTCLAEC